MTYDDRAAMRVRRILSRRATFEERRMFGGLCFLVNGGMCCGFTSAGFMVRVGRDRYEEALAQPHARPMDFTGRPLTGMVYVDPAGYETDRALEQWVRRGLDFAERRGRDAGVRPVRRRRAGFRRSRSPRN